VEKVVYITTVGVLTVTVDVRPSRIYVGDSADLLASWRDGVGPYDIVVDWGDGTRTSITDYPYTSISLSHTYGIAGDLTAVVYVFDTYTGAEGSGSDVVYVRPPLTATLDASPTSGAIPLDVTFTFSASGGFKPYDWTLDFGDGTTPASGTGWDGSTKTVVHTYEKVGEFKAVLTVIDALGVGLRRELAILPGIPVIPAMALISSAVGLGLLALAKWMR